MALLKLTGIGKKGEGDFLLSGITFSQRKLEKIAIAGETGAGKSTLLRIIAGLAQPDSGEVVFEGEHVTGPADQLVPGHPRIAYLSQHFELQKFLRVEQVLTYSNTLPDREADRLYDVCQITHLLKRKTDQLSGGEKQRIAICRLLTTGPRLLLLDEPFSHLDLEHKNTLKEVIRDIGEKLKITCILVSHDPLDTLSWADKILVMKEGKIIQKGRSARVYRQPVNEYTAGLFGKYNIIPRGDLGALAPLKPLKKYTSPNGRKSIFVRPEQIQIVKRGPQTVRGKVEKVQFFGGYCEIEVAVSNITLTIKTGSARLEKGDTVHFSIAEKDLWLV